MKWIQFQQGNYTPGCCFRSEDLYGYIYFNGAVGEDGKPFDADGQVDIKEEDYPNVYFLDESNDEVEQLRDEIKAREEDHQRLVKEIIRLQSQDKQLRKENTKYREALEKIASDDTKVTTPGYRKLKSIITEALTPQP